MKASTASSLSTTRILRFAMTAILRRGRHAIDEAQLGAVEVPAQPGERLRQPGELALRRAAFDQPALLAGPLEAVEGEAAGERMSEGLRRAALARAERGLDLIEHLAPRDEERR